MNFNKIYNEYKNKIFRFTFNYSNNLDEQEELVQEIFFNFFLSLKNFKKKSSIGTYLFSIARNVCVKYINKVVNEKKKIDRLIKLYEIKHEESPEDKYVGTEDTKFFLNILNKIASEYKESFYLYEIENFSYKEISNILSIPMGTVKSRINRAKENIVELIKNDKKGDLL